MYRDTWVYGLDWFLCALTCLILEKSWSDKTNSEWFSVYFLGVSLLHCMVVFLDDALHTLSAELQVHCVPVIPTEDIRDERQDPSFVKLAQVVIVVVH